MKRIVLFLFWILLAFDMFCNEHCHLIVSIDLRSEIIKSRPNYTISETKRIVPKFLRKYGINDGYVSILLWGINEDEENVDSYMNIINRPFNEFKGHHNLLDTLNIDEYNRYFGNYYSIVTIAKPYSLLKFKSIEPNILVDKTYLVLVTDYKYNGNDDFYGELKHVKRISKTKKENIMNIVKDVQQNYFYKFIDEESISSYYSQGYVSLFEVIPLQKYFAIESLLDFPHTIQAKRTKDGYQATFNIKSLENNNYEFLTSTTFIPVSGYEQQTEIREFDKDYIINVPNELVEQVGKDNITIVFESWVHLLDGVYNHTILSPMGSKLQGAEGLKRNIKVELEKDAKILGFIPLNDTLFRISFWTDDQDSAAATWGWIFIMIIMGIVVALIWKSTIYKNKNNDVTL